MDKQKNIRKHYPKRKSRIVVELQNFREQKSELMRLADHYGWELYDLSINLFHLPTNPEPDGAIISRKGGTINPEDENRVFNFPTVRFRIDNYAIPDIYPMVSLDQYSAGEMAADYFYENGFKNIMITQTNPWEDAVSVYKGAFDRAKALNINFHRLELHQSYGENSHDKHDRWSHEIGDYVNSLPRPLAYLGGNDSLAARFAFNCQSYGLSIPEDIVILGIGNTVDICKMAPVPLSSIDLNRTLALQKAADLLNRVLAGDAEPDESIVVPPKGIVRRRSTELLAVSEPRVARALRFMWDHLDWPLSLDDIAHEVGVPKRTLARLFQKHLGRGINEELRRKRLETCCELLKLSDEKVDTISKRAGFPSTPHLNRMFKDQYGITPSQFRNQSKMAQ